MSQATPLAARGRRVVTGLDAAGRSCFVHDDPVPPATATVGLAWATTAIPADNAAPSPPPSDPIGMMHAGGAVFLVITAPPGHFAPMHTTETIDFLTVVSGEITLITEDGEKVLRAGDVCIDRGIVHAWRNDGAVDAVYTCVAVPSLPLAGAQRNPAR